MNKKQLIAAIALACVAFTAGILANSRPNLPQTTANSSPKHFFSLSMKDSSGKNQLFDQYKGKFLVINFWATWCAPCVQEMPELSALQKEFSIKNIQFIGLGIDSPSNISEFEKKYKISYPLFSAGMEGTELSKQMGNQTGGLPFTVLLSANGNVVKTYTGRLNMKNLRDDILQHSKN